MLRDAVTRNLEIISEASRHLDEEAKGPHADIPWRQIADLGNRLRHAYFRTDFDLLWGIVENDLDSLASAVSEIRDRLLAADSPPSQS